MLYDFAFFKLLIPLPVDGANLLHQTASLGWSGDRWHVGQRVFLLLWLQIRLFWLGLVSGASYQWSSILVLCIFAFNSQSWNEFLLCLFLFQIHR